MDDATFFAGSTYPHAFAKESDVPKVTATAAHNHRAAASRFGVVAPLERWGIILASYGTSDDEARARGIDVLAQMFTDEIPICAFAQAFTSAKARARLDARGVHVPSVDEALDQMAKAGVTHVVVQSGHIAVGSAFSIVRDAVEAHRDQFETICLGEPLLSGPDDIERVARALVVRHSPRPGEVVVLMGHCTGDSAGAIYAALGREFNELKRGDILVGSYGGHPDIDDIIPMLGMAAGHSLQRHEPSVTLAPLMLSAGAHARAQMAGEAPTSWRSKLEAAGCKVRCDLVGLAELPEVRRIFFERAQAAFRLSRAD